MFNVVIAVAAVLNYFEIEGRERKKTYSNQLEIILHVHGKHKFFGGLYLLLSCVFFSSHFVVWKEITFFSFSTQNGIFHSLAKNMCLLCSACMVVWKNCVYVCARTISVLRKCFVKSKTTTAKKIKKK